MHGPHGTDAQSEDDLALPEGNVPPQVIHEQTVLGNILLDPKCIYDVLPLSQDDFEVPFHKRIWVAIQKLHDSDRDASLSAILTESGIEKVDARLRDYMVGLANLVPVIGFARESAEEVRKYSTNKAIRKAALEIIDLADINSPETFAAARRLSEIASGRNQANVWTFEEVMGSSVQILAERRSGVSPKPIHTGFPCLERSNTFRPGDLVFLAASTSVGKTILGFQVAMTAAFHGHTSMLASLEMTKEQLAMRALAARSKVLPNQLNLPALDDDEWGRVLEAAEDMGKWPVHIMDVMDGEISLDTIAATARRHKHTHGLELMVVDYLQLLPMPDLEKGRITEARAIGNVTRKMKMLAMELGITILVLSQVNREGTKSDKLRIHNLLGSSSIGNDSNTVILLNPDLKGSNFDEWKGMKVRPLIMAIEKNRDGPCFDQPVTFNSDTLIMRETAR